ncbi:MAG: 23S rRNA (guanosine(2251)-2'-O)-methyltransferase RlmB [Mycoplasmataceae bacterium]|nr:23S rRNA (guanosine(2251)-2'-O)-methyltransferase RlmB [Mycoplasmataceae bacterium]MBR4025414.1 23S rRNA (guanosine(2251)-2'-O)-methyltransferase RlmB [Mycoplasmataceae bacterium]
MSSKFICGKNSVQDAIKNNVSISKILSIKELDFNVNNIKVEIVSKFELDKITNLNHQGIIAILKNDFQYHSLEEILKNKPKVILVLDHIEDPHNLGAILRSANAAGINSIILPTKRSAEVNNVVLKISSGGFVGMKIAKVSSLQSTITKLKKANYWIYSSVLNKESKNYSMVNYNFPLVLVVGNESKGISKTLIKESDELIYIPIKGTVQSLNVSVATGIMLFEIIKKANF